MLNVHTGYSLDITLESDAIMYLGDASVVTPACASMDSSTMNASSIMFDIFTASSGTAFYGKSHHTQVSLFPLHAMLIKKLRIN